MKITDLHNPWRDRFQQASFRGVIFHVDTDARAGGRRVALHQYPKRNDPYAEDMGRSANRFTVQGYLIGPNYLDIKTSLINALEQDGPGILYLPMPYSASNVNVMVMQYSVTENRERGGMCGIDMEFVEYGTPANRATTTTASQVTQTASALAQTVAGTGLDPTQLALYQQFLKSISTAIDPNFPPL